MAVTTAANFLDVVEKSDLLTEQQMAKVRKAVNGHANPQAIAKLLVKQGLLTKWQVQRLWKGQRVYLGKYRLLDQLGSGGMGQVFLGEHTAMRRRVALKTLTRRDSSDRRAIERFLSEARAIAALNHPNIIQAYDVDSENDCYYLVMEYVKGRDLQQVVEEEGLLAYEYIADFIRQAAAGLEHAHANGIVHRDIKPANLLLDEQGMIRLLDMGVARLAENEQTDAGESGLSLLGTVDYVAPEQAAEKPADQRSDVYSLGCTLYFLLTGHPPFPEGSMAERLIKHQRKEPRSVLHARPDVPPMLAKICRKMMAKDPDARFQSAADVAKALERFIREYGKSPTATPRPVVERPTTRRQSTSSAPPSSEPSRSAPPPKRKQVARAEAPPEIEEEEEEFEEASPFGEFAIATGGNGGVAVDTGGATAVAIQAKPETEGEAKPVDMTPRKKKNFPWMLVGVCVAGLVVTIAAVVLLGKKDEPVAENDAKDAPAAAAAEEDKPLEEEPLEDEGEGSGDLDDLGLDNLLGGSSNTSTEQPAEEGSDEPKDDGGEKPKLPEDAVAKVDPENKEPAEGETTTTEPMDPKSAAPMAGTDDEGSTSENPDEPKSDDPKTEPKDPPADKPEPAKPKPPADPLKDFPAVVELPADGTDPISLGKLPLGENQKLFLNLLGGSSAHRGSEVFTLDRGGPGGTSNTEWNLSLVDGSNKTVVGKLAIEEGEMLFQWTQEGLDSQNANYLRNCVLSMRAGSGKKDLALRKPVTAEGLIVDLKGRMESEVDVKWAPPTSQLKLEITSLDGGFPEKQSFLPGKKVDFEEVKMQITLGDGIPQVFQLELATKAARKLEVTATPYFLLPGMTKPDKMTQNAVRAKFALANNAQQKIEMGTAAIAQQQNQQLKQQMEQQLNAFKQYVDALDRLNLIATGIDGKGTIQYRIFAQVETAEVDLVKTGGGGAGGAGGNAFGK